MEDECFPKDANLMKEHLPQVSNCFVFPWFICHSISYVCLSITSFCSFVKHFRGIQLKTAMFEKNCERIVYHQLNCNAKRGDVWL